MLHQPGCQGFLQRAGFVPQPPMNSGFSFLALLTGIKCKLGGGPPLLPHLVPVHDDFPAVSLERLHPVFRPHAGRVSLRLLGQERKPDGDGRSTTLFYTSSFTHATLFKAFVQKSLSERHSYRQVLMGGFPSSLPDDRSLLWIHGCTYK